MNFPYKVYGDRVIGLGYPKFAQAGIGWPPYSPDLNKNKTSPNKFVLLVPQNK